MAASDIVRRVCLFYKLLSGKPRRALRFERNIRFFIEFLVDRGTWSWRPRTASRSTVPPAETVETWQRRVFDKLRRAAPRGSRSAFLFGKN